MVEFLAWLIPLAPLAAVVVTVFAGRRMGPRAHAPCVGALALSFVAAFGLLSLGGLAEHPRRAIAGPAWLAAGDLVVHLTLRADALTAVMLVAVTFVSMLVAIYSIGYMHDDPGYVRFFAEIALFVFSMTMLVLTSNLLVLYVFWEAVGVCSYLLIGYWFSRPSAAAAAKKAFLVNRIGDFGFAVGIFLIWSLVGNDLEWAPPAGAQLLDYDVVFEAMRRVAGEQPQMVVLACLLLFMGAVGKSAQFPLHVWLPDAMEGPTPVSALIHAATMVTAGVYLVARMTPLFVLAPQAQIVVASIGGFTALLAAFIALTQNDLKRVMAYSTVSQLGYMFLALGAAAGHEALARLAVVAAIFHLFTHAFFKALLFLGSGSVMHAMNDVIDIRQFGGLRRLLPTTHWTFLCGAVALAGLPPFSGFWSKDEILAVVAEGTNASAYSSLLKLLLTAALATSFLTAFYTFRAYFLTFWGPERLPEGVQHPHESPPVMLRPLMVLAAGALVLGVVFGPTHWFGHYLGHTPGLPEAEPPHLNWGLMGTSALVGLAGAGLAAAVYLRRPDLAARTANALKPLYNFSLRKCYFDELYWWVIVRPIQILALVFRILDLYLIDGIVNFIGWMPVRIGENFRSGQNGKIQSYARMMAVGLATLLLVAVLNWGG